MGALCLKEGDKNTKFFHRIANSSRSCNSIENLIINGVTSSNPPDIKAHIIHFYSQLYSENEHWRTYVNGLPFQSICEEAIWLEQAFKERGVFEVMEGINEDKALGPDGFPMAFI